MGCLMVRLPRRFDPRNDVLGSLLRMVLMTIVFVDVLYVIAKPVGLWQSFFTEVYKSVFSCTSRMLFRRLGALPSHEVHDLVRLCTS